MSLDESSKVSSSNSLTSSGIKASVMVDTGTYQLTYPSLENFKSANNLPTIESPESKSGLFELPQKLNSVKDNTTAQNANSGNLTYPFSGFYVFQVKENGIVNFRYQYSLYLYSDYVSTTGKKVRAVTSDVSKDDTSYTGKPRWTSSSVNTNLFRDTTYLAFYLSGGRTFHPFENKTVKGQNATSSLPAVSPRSSQVGNAFEIVDFDATNGILIVQAASSMDRDSYYFATLADRTNYRLRDNILNVYFNPATTSGSDEIEYPISNPAVWVVRPTTLNTQSSLTNWYNSSWNNSGTAEVTWTGFAHGKDNKVLSFGASAFGRRNVVLGQYGWTAGTGNLVTGYASAAYGNNNMVLNESSMAVGAKNQCNGFWNYAFGYGLGVNGLYNFNVGVNTTSPNITSSRLKVDNFKGSKFNFSIGRNNFLFNCDGSLVVGAENTMELSGTSGDSVQTNATRYGNFICGYNNTLNGSSTKASAMIGENNTINNTNNIAIGSNITVNTDNSIVLGQWNSGSTPNGVLIGVGTSSSNKKNAASFENDKTTIFNKFRIPLYTTSGSVSTTQCCVLKAQLNTDGNIEFTFDTETI